MLGKKIAHSSQAQEFMAEDIAKVSSAPEPHARRKQVLLFERHKLRPVSLGIHQSDHCLNTGSTERILFAGKEYSSYLTTGVSGVKWHVRSVTQNSMLKSAFGATAEEKDLICGTKFGSPRNKISHLSSSRSRPCCRHL